MTRTARTSKALAEAQERDRRNQLAIQAHDLRRQGKAWWDIAEELHVTEDVASMLVSERIKFAADLVDEGSRRILLAMEVDRLDSLQSAVWVAAMAGDTKAVDTVLKIIDKRSKLLGLENAQGQTVTNNTIVVQGNTEQYVAALREASMQPLEAPRGDTSD